MRKSTRVALLSGLVFPGVGHMVLKKRWRGSILMLFSVVALSVIVKVAIERAMNVVDSMASGEIPVDTGAITELAASSLSSSDNSLVSYALIVLGACWLFGIIDSYRLCNAQEK